MGRSSTKQQPLRTESDGLDGSSLRPPGETTLAAAFSCAFLTLALVGLWNHEMWRDELQAWMIARDSGSIGALLRNLRYEGHPALWHLCLFLLSRFSRDPFTMQALHALIATASVFLFIRYAPFSPSTRILFCLGYFPFYEYAIISRNYAPGMLLLIAFCAAYTTPRKNYLLLGLVLFLLANTSAYGLLLSITCGSVLLADVPRARSERRVILLHPRNPLLGGWILAVVGWLRAVYQISPPPDAGNATGAQMTLRLSRLPDVLMTVWMGYVPIPALTVHFWGTNVLTFGTGKFAKGLCALLSLCLLASACHLVCRVHTARGSYILGTSLLLFFGWMMPGAIRHYGHLYLIFLASLWLACRNGDFTPSLLDRRFLAVLLCVQAGAGLFAYIADLKMPFSASKAAAAYLRQHRLDSLPMLGDTDFAASPVAALLDRPIYYPASDRFGTFILWNNRRKPVQDADVLNDAFSLSRKTDGSVVLVLNRALKARRAGLRLTLLRAFLYSNNSDEVYYIYLAQASSRVLDFGRAQPVPPSGRAAHVPTKYDADQRSFR